MPKGPLKKPRRPNTSDAEKAAIVQHLLQGLGTTQVARKLNLDINVVSRIKHELPPELAMTIAARRSEIFEERLTDALEKGIQAIAAQFEIASDPAYLRDLSGSELALLNSVTFDRVIQLLTAAQAAGRGDGEAAEPPTIDIQAIHPAG